MIQKLFVLFFCGITQVYADAPVEMGDANIRRLEQDLHVLQKFVYKRFGGGHDYQEENITPPVEADKDLSDKTEQIELSLQELTRKIEELTHKLENVSAELNEQKMKFDGQTQQIADLKTEMKAQKALGFEERLDQMPEDKFLNYIENESKLLSEGDRAKALHKFVERFPKSKAILPPLKDLIYILYKQGNYKDAARYAGIYYKQDPNGSDTPELLMLLAYSLQHLGKTDQACTTFTKIKTYKNLKPDLLERITTTEKDYACKPKGAEKSA